MAKDAVVDDPMKRVKVIIEGRSPMLMHRFSPEAQEGLKARTRKVQTKLKTPKEIAEDCVHRKADGTVFFPGTAILRMLAEVGGSEKQVGSRKSLKWLIGGAVIPPEMIDIYVPDYDESGRWNGVDWRPARNEYEVDEMSAVNAVTKARIISTRARFDYWQGRFEFTINEGMIAANVIRDLLSRAGLTQGLGTYGPRKMGPYGTFDVNHWELKTGYVVEPRRAPVFDPRRARPAAK